MTLTTRIERTLSEGELDLLVASSVENVFYSAQMYSVATAGLGEAAFSLWSADAGGPYLVMPAREMSSLFDMGADPAGVYPYGATNIYTGESLSDLDREIRDLQESGSFDDPVDALNTAIDELADGDRIAIEKAGFDPTSYAQLEGGLEEYRIEEATEHFHDLRKIKTDEEKQRLRQAAEITATSMEEAMETLEPGMSERELANEWRARVCEKGGQPIDGFLTVGFGSRTAYTHPLPGDREIRDGDLVRWDGGCRYEQYCSDIGRTFAFGSVDDDDIRKYEALYSGLEASLSEFGSGVETDVVFESGVDAVRSSGVDALSEFEPFHLGHGIGVEIYDPPTIVTDAGTLESGMVMCVEPPYNELGNGGFLIEDEVVVTDNGYEKLTDAPETLPVIE